MNASPVYCTKCGASLPAALLNLSRLAPCPACGAEIMVAAFPVVLGGAVLGKTGEVLLSDEEASCFYHPARRAVAPCDQCGRFLCALCDVRIGHRHLCPGCIEAAGDRRRHTELDTHRVLYDNLALLTAALPLAVTPLITLYLAARYWSAPSSLLRRTRPVWVAAVVLALGQIAFWCWLVFYVIARA